MALRQRNIIGTISDGDGAPIVNGQVKFKPTKPLAYTTSHIIVDAAFSVQTGEDGSFEIDIWCDEDSLVQVDYNVYFPTANGGQADNDHGASFSLQYGDGSDINLAVLINASVPAPTPEELLYTMFAEMISEASLGGSGGPPSGGAGGVLSGTYPNPGFAVNMAEQSELDAVVARTISAGIGLSGGGNLSANRTLALDINGLTEETTAADGDFIAVYDLSAGALRKMSRTNFLAGISSGGMTIGDPVTDADAGSVLFVDDDGNLGQHEAMVYDNTNGQLQLTQRSGYVAPLQLRQSLGQAPYGYYMQFTDSTGANSLGEVRGANGYLSVEPTVGIEISRYGFNGGIIRFDVRTGTANPFHIQASQAVSIPQIIKLFEEQTADAFQIKDSDNAVLYAVGAKGEVKPSTLADSDAPNNSIYYSSDASKLVYKNTAGSVLELY